MNKTITDFLDEATPRELLEAYFDAKTNQKGLISSLPNELVEKCISGISSALEMLPVYGKDNKVFTREKYLEAKKRLKKSGFKF